MKEKNLIREEQSADRARCVCRSPEARKYKSLQRKACWLEHKETGDVARKEGQGSGDPRHQALCARVEMGGALTKRGG